MGSGRARRSCTCRGPKSDRVVPVDQRVEAGRAWFMSFKRGSGEAVRNGRFFNDYDEDSLRALMEQHLDLQVVRIWTTQDARKGQSGSSGPTRW